MTNHSRTTVCLKAAQSYLEAEFPGQVEAASETEITVSHDDVRHHIVLQPEFLKQCSTIMRLPCARVNSLTIYVNPGRNKDGASS